MRFRSPLPAARRLRRLPRRGSATLWLVIWLPCLLVLFCVLVGTANLWLGRIELENALEGAALAAVKHWGESTSGDTLEPRLIGVAYAQANYVRDRAVLIGPNYDPQGGPNQNDRCTFTEHDVTPANGNLVFGSIDDTNPSNVIFNAGLPPSCGPKAIVVVDVTSNGELNDNQNEWGIAFHPTPSTPAGLRIEYVEFTIPANQGIIDFDHDFEISPNDPGQYLVRELPSYRQPDVYGFTDPIGQVVATYPSPRKLRIDFLADTQGNDTDAGFEPCDRIRFGNGVQFAGGSDPNKLDGFLQDADGLGHVHTQVKVHFSDGSDLVGTLFDTSHGKNQCQLLPSSLPCSAGATNNQNQPVARHVIHPTKIDDLPCPVADPGNGQPTNNGQSLGILAPAGAGKFGVRAQASVPVQSLGLGSFVGKITDYCVRAETVAEYDCATKRVRLVRIHTFICPGPQTVAKVCKCRP